MKAEWKYIAMQSPDKKLKDIQKMITAVRTAPNQDVATFIENFNTKKIARSVYQCKHNFLS